MPVNTIVWYVKWSENGMRTYLLTPLEKQSPYFITKIAVKQGGILYVLVVSCMRGSQLEVWLEVFKDNV